MTVDERHHSPYFAPRRTAHEPVAQSVEQLTFNQWVVGSIPTGLAISPKMARYHSPSSKSVLGAFDRNLFAVQLSLRGLRQTNF